MQDPQRNLFCLDFQRDAEKGTAVIRQLWNKRNRLSAFDLKAAKERGQVGNLALRIGGNIRMPMNSENIFER